MLQIIAIIAVILGLAIVVVLTLASRKPDTLRVERSAVISASPQPIFDLINDFHRWRLWSPYEAKDPNMARTFSGAERGPGAVYEWSGDRNVGSGRMEITDTSEPNHLAIKLDFYTPFEGHNVADFTMQPQGGGTTVVIWAMQGPAPFMSKLMQVILDLDAMIGKDFTSGLANLKTIAEAQPAAASTV